MYGRRSLYDDPIRYDADLAYDGGWPESSEAPSILLIDIGPSSARRFARLATVDLGEELELSAAAQVVTCVAASASMERSARSTIEGSRRCYWEVSPFGLGPLTGKFSAGILPSGASSSSWPGEVTASYGYRPGDSAMYAAGSSVASVAEGVARDTIGFALDCDANELQVLLNGILLHTFTLEPDRSYFPAVALGSTDPSDVAALVNFGTRAFRYPVPEGYSAGVSTAIGSQATYRFSGAITAKGAPLVGWLSASDDNPANERWLGRITNASQFAIDRSVSFWPDGARSGGFQAADVLIDNQDGAFDDLLLAPPRDCPVTARLARWGRPLSESIVVGTMIVDRTEQASRTSIRVKLRDRIATWQRPLQRKLIPPWAVEGAGNRPVPIALGACRNVEPVLVGLNEGDTAGTYLLHDGQLTNVAVVRDRGDPLDIGAGDYGVTADLSGITLNELPQGKLTADISTSGTLVIEPGATDVLDGDGEFTSWTADSPSPSDTPNGWEVFGDAMFAAPNQGGQVNDGGGVAVIQSRTNGGIYWMRTVSTVLEAGKTYRWTLTVLDFSQSLDLFGIRHGGWALASDELSLAAATTGSDGLIAAGGEAGVFSGYYPVPAGSDRRVFLGAFMDTGITSGGAQVVGRFDGLRFEELTEVVDVPLAGITLREYLRQVLEVRGGESADSWSADDAQAIDDATGYVIGVAISDQVTLEAAVRAPLDSFCADIVTDDDGVLRIVRLVDPDSVPDDEIALEINSINLASAPTFSLDLAPGLTSQLGARRNWSVYGASDFVDDFDPLTGIDAATRARFRRASQYQVGMAVALDPLFAHAELAAELTTVLDVPAHAQAEANRVGLQHTGPRLICDCTVRFQGAPPEVLPGRVVRLTWPGYGCENGLKFFVKRARPTHLAGVIDLLCVRKL